MEQKQSTLNERAFAYSLDPVHFVLYALLQEHPDPVYGSDIARAYSSPEMTIHDCTVQDQLKHLHRAKVLERKDGPGHQTDRPRHYYSLSPGRVAWAQERIDRQRVIYGTACIEHLRGT